MDNTTIGLIFTGIGLFAMVAKDLFGGGGKLANAFHALDKKTSEAVTALDVKHTSETTRLRLEMLDKIELRDNNARIGFESISANMHIMKEALLENRAKMAEEYMSKGSFYKATDELKRDFKEKHDDLKHEMHQGFADLKDQIGAVAQSIEAGRQSTRHHTTK